MLLHGRRKVINDAIVQVNRHLFGVQRHAVETHVAKRAIAIIGWRTSTVACTDEDIMGIGDSPIVHGSRPTAVGLAVMINTNLVVGAVHDKCKMHPLAGRHSHARIDRQSVSRGGSRGIKPQGLPRIACPKELVT